MQQLIIRILSEICPYEEITPETELLEEGVLDSMDITQLLSRLEQELDISIPPESLDPMDFADTAAIEELIRRSM